MTTDLKIKFLPLNWRRDNNIITRISHSDNNGSTWLRYYTRSQPYQTFFLCKSKFFPFFAIKLGHLIVNTFFLCCKHLSVTMKIGKQRKTKFGRINSRGLKLKCQQGTRERSTRIPSLQVCKVYIFQWIW